jgi:hypothetical protein
VVVLDAANLEVEVVGTIAVMKELVWHQAVMGPVIGFESRMLPPGQRVGARKWVERVWIAAAAALGIVAVEKKHGVGFVAKMRPGFGYMLYSADAAGADQWNKFAACHTLVAVCIEPPVVVESNFEIVEIVHMKAVWTSHMSTVGVDILIVQLVQCRSSQLLQ